MYWAAKRNLNADIVYTTFIGKGKEYLEQRIPDEIAFTAYSGYVNLFGNDVSDYGEVYVYATDLGLEEIKKRFPKKSLSSSSKYSDLIVLKPDKILLNLIENKKLSHSSVSMTQICVDLWNIKEWYAERFFAKTYDRIKSIIKDQKK